MISIIIRSFVVVVLGFGLTNAIYKYPTIYNSSIGVTFLVIMIIIDLIISGSIMADVILKNFN